MSLSSIKVTPKTVAGGVAVAAVAGVTAWVLSTQRRRFFVPILLKRFARRLLSGKTTEIECVEYVFQVRSCPACLQEGWGRGERAPGGCVCVREGA
jgi:hypothetical protein